MSLLLIDIGNSTIHWAIQAPGQTLSAMQSNSYRNENIDAILTAHWSALKPISRVMIASVASEAVNLCVQHWLQQQWQITPQFVHAEARGHGVHNAYVEPQQLGSDRWMAMVAA